MYEIHKDFIEWASKYDTGGLEMRSKATNEKWMKKISCQILRIERQADLGESIRIVKNKIKDLHNVQIR